MGTVTLKKKHEIEEEVYEIPKWKSGEKCLILSISLVKLSNDNLTKEMLKIKHFSPDFQPWIRFLENTHHFIPNTGN